MALSTIPAYDSDRVNRHGGHAVVVGAGIAGLVAARVVADAYDTVTLIERDALSSVPRHRDGCPQGVPANVLWESCRTVLEAFFPGLEDELVDHGAVRVDLAVDGRFVCRGGDLAPGRERHQLVSVSRPLLEHVLRSRLTERDDVHVRSSCHCVGYLIPDGTSIAGVSLQDESTGPSTMTADLVVDATGCASQTPGWLAAHGFPEPPLEEVPINLVSASAIIDRPPSARGMISVWPTAPHARGAMVVPVERDRWQVTLFGVTGDHPPVEPSLFAQFATDLPTPRVDTLLDRHPLIRPDIVCHRGSAPRRRRYEAIDRVPNGLAVIGDAVASYDPRYGQGTAATALQALQLHHALAGAGFDPSTYYRRVAAVVDVAWMLTPPGEFCAARTSGPPLRTRALTTWYLDRMLRRAHHDGRLTDAFLAVASLREPPQTLARPAVARRVLAPQLSVPRPASFL